MLALPSISGSSGGYNRNVPNKNVNRRQLSQTEYEEKIAKNLCCYCDQKYSIGHKCAGQMYYLEVLPDELSVVDKFID